MVLCLLVGHRFPILIFVIEYIGLVHLFVYLTEAMLAHGIKVLALKLDELNLLSERFV